MAPKKPIYDPDGKYLIQDGSGHIYQWSEKLADRKDMRAYDPTGKKPIEPAPATKGLVEIELQGKSFMVEQALYDLLAEMGEKWTAMQEAVEALTAEKTDFEAFKVRLDTDNADLAEQLKAANEKILEFQKPEGPAEPGPDAKTKKGK